MERYCHFGDDGNACRLAIPQIDREIASLIVLCLMEKRSAGLLYPFPESDFSILPLLGPLAHLLVGTPGYHVLASRSCDWKEVYKKIGKNQTCQRDEQLRFLHPYGTVGMNGQIVSHATSRDSTRKVNIVFSRASSSAPLVWNDDIRGIIVDVGPPRARLSARRVNELLNLSISHNVPCVVIFNNANSAARHLLDENRIEILSWRKERESEVAQPDVENTKMAAHSGDFPDTYHSWSSKIRSGECNRPVRILEIADSDEMTDGLQELNARLSSLLASSQPNSARHLEESILAYASFVESRARTMWTTKSDYDRAASESYCGESMEASSIRLDRMSRELYSQNARVATEAIRFSDQYRRVVKVLDSVDTAKSRYVERNIRSEQIEPSQCLLNYGRIPQKASNIFLERCCLEKARPSCSSSHNLSSMPNGACILLPGYPLYANCSLLFTASAQQTTVLCYPWEIPILKRRIEHMCRCAATWHSNTVAFLQKIASPQSVDQGRVCGDGFSDPDLISVETSERFGRRDGPPTNVTLRDLYDFLELGERPESEVMTPSSESVQRYTDVGSNPKWLVTTDQGRLLVSEDRKLTVVCHTYTEACLPANIRVGDVIMVGKDFNPRPMSDYVWDIMAMRGLTKEGAIWREWKKRLREYVESRPGEDSRTVFESLRELGSCGIETPQAVYAWLNSDDLIGPQSKDTIMCLGKLLGATQAECELWWASIRQVRSALMSAYSHLWKLARYHASHLASGDSEDVIVSPELDIWLSDLSELVTFARVISQPQYMAPSG